MICTGPQICTLTDLDPSTLDVFHPCAKDVNGAAQNGGGGASKDDRLVCMGLSGCGAFLAVCGEDKSLLVYKNKSLVGRSVLTRKANKLTFTRDSRSLIIADKNGDVYSYTWTDDSDAENKPKLVLGHLSMLLDTILDPTNRYLLTADRDEKIRVSMYPNCYNIHNFCLGHTDFVTSISLLNDALLVSGSGDGTIRIWRYLKGVQVAVREVAKDAPVKIDRKLFDDADTDRKRNEPSDVAAVVKVKALYNQKIFLAQVEGCQNLQVYSFTDGDADVKHVQALPLPHPLLDFDVDQETLVCLTHCPDRRVALHRFIRQGEGFTASGDDAVKLEVMVEDQGGGDLRNLHKRWFDNMKDYLERKQMRIENAKSRTDDAGGVKKLKLSEEQHS